MMYSTLFETQKFVECICDLDKQYNLVYEALSTLYGDNMAEQVMDGTNLFRCDHNTGYYKIGRSNSPNFRERKLQSEKPTIEMICTCDKNIETELHQIFDCKRILGEWFDLSNEDVLF